MQHIEIESIADFNNLSVNAVEITEVAFQNIDFSKIEPIYSHKKYSHCLFLGCDIPNDVKHFLAETCLVFPIINVPFNPYRNKLYSNQTLIAENYVLGSPESYENTPDKIIYKHYLEQGKTAEHIQETLARRLHDHAITDALHDFLAPFDERKIVAIMGGHNISRNDSNYFTIAKISKQLTESGYFLTSGGGPGAMEATHVGAWMAGRDDAELIDVIAILSQAPSYKDTHWLDKAFVCLEKYPTSDYESLGIPTWLYGHEPPTPFASKIAKYFANSVREDILLTIAKGGIIFSPGSAGTIQEIFQDATQNHYLSFGYASPMVFLNTQYWTEEKPVYSLLKKLSDEDKYRNMLLSCCDTFEEVIIEIEAFTENTST